MKCISVKISGSLASLGVQILVQNRLRAWETLTKYEGKSREETTEKAGALRKLQTNLDD